MKNELKPDCVQDEPAVVVRGYWCKIWYVSRETLCFHDWIGNFMCSLRWAVLLLVFAWGFVVLVCGYVTVRSAWAGLPAARPCFISLSASPTIVAAQIRFSWTLTATRLWLGSRDGNTQDGQFFAEMNAMSRYSAILRTLSAKRNKNIRTWS
jgi:hypothetical protein